MTEVILQSHAGDSISNLFKTAIEIVKVPTVSYACILDFNGVNMYIKKNDTEETLMEEYLNRLKQTHG